jgi:ABC-type multidrug transport system ATPase subunit
MEEAEECTRLMVMAAGRVVAEGTSGEIVGACRVVVVQTDAWPDALRAIDAAGLRAVLAGTTLRVPGASVPEVTRALVGLQARVHEEKATLEERFFELTRQDTREATRA